MEQKYSALNRLFFQRTYVLYAVGLFILVSSVESNRARNVHLDSLKPIEGYFEKFSENQMTFHPEKFKDGVRYFQKVLDALPSFQALAYGHLGFCHFYLGNDLTAAKMYQKAIEMKPLLYAFPYDMGIIALRRGDYRNAQVFLARSAMLLDSNEQFFGELSRQFEKAGKRDVALLAQKCIKRLNDDRRHLSYLLGVTHFYLKDYAAAVTLLSAAITDNPDFPMAYYYRGKSYGELAQPERSRNDLLKASTLRNRTDDAEKTEEGIFRLHFNPMIVNFLS